MPQIVKVVKTNEMCASRVLTCKWVDTELQSYVGHILGPQDQKGIYDDIYADLGYDTRGIY